MRALAVITLSKMALHNDLFARSLVTGLAQLLDQSSDPVVLNNVIVAIADIGESYANLIEPLIPFICVCLKSKHKSLKETTLILLVELLQEDYLKARGALVFHLLTMINDPDPWLVNIVKYYFTNSLIARNPYKMYQLLLPGLFHLNNYTNHPDYPKMDMTEAEWKAFDLSGAENHSRRMNIYQFMLSNVPDMVKMKGLHFICTVVLNGAADNLIPIKSGNGEQLLFDALCMLLTPEIKIEYNDLVKKKNEDGEEEDDPKQNPLYKLGKQMFTAVQKKEIIETIVPICCKLKKKLLVENKKLLPYLHKFVRELVKDYKSEISEIFKEDKQFGVEILHELDKIANNELEEEEEEEEPEVPVITAVNKSMSRAERAERRASRSGGTLPSIPEQSFEEVDGVVKTSNDSSRNNSDESEQGKRLDLSKVSSMEVGISKTQTEDSKTAETVETTKSEKEEQEQPVEENRSESKMVGEKPNPDTPITDRLTVPLERLSSKCLKVLEKQKSRDKNKKSEKKSEGEEKNMKKAMNDIIMPPPAKSSVKSRKNSLTKSVCNKTPTTPIVGGRKELLTSTPLVRVDNPDFDMDISAVVDKSS